MKLEGRPDYRSVSVLTILIGASLRKKSCGPRHFSSPAGETSAARSLSSSTISTKNGEREAALHQKTASQVCETIRRLPRWESSLLSVFPPSTSGILHPKCISLAFRCLSNSNPLLSLRFLLWLSSFSSSFSLDSESATSLISALTASRAWRPALQAIRLINCLHENSELSSFVISLCSDTRSIRWDESLLNDLCNILENHSPLSVSLPSWKAALSASLVAERIDLFQRFYAMMIESGTAPDASTAGYLIRAFCREGKPAEAYHVLCDVARNRITPDVISVTELVSSFSKAGNFGGVSRILHLMIAGGCPPDLFTYQAIIHSLCKGAGCHMVEEALRIFGDLKLKGYAPDIVTYTTIISGLSKSSRMEEAWLLWSEMVAKGIQPNNYTYNAIIDGYCKSGDMDHARKLYDEMLSKGFKESTVNCNTMMAGLCLKGRLTEAINLFDEMPKRGIEHDVVTYNTLIQGLCKGGKIGDAIELHLRMVATGIKPSISTFSPLVKALCDEGRVPEATELMNLMEAEGLEPLVCTNDFIITGFCRVGGADEGMAWLSKMLQSNLKPRAETVNRLVECLSSFGRLDDALRVVNNMFDIGYSLGSSVCHLLISKLSEKGSHQTVQILDEIKVMET